MHRSALALLVLMAAVPAVARAPDESSAERLQRRLAGLIPGRPTGCVTLSPSSRSQTYDGVSVYQFAGTTYVNRFGGGCPVRPDFDILVTSTPTTQLCRGDIAQIVDGGSRINRGSCIYGDWETYTRPKKAK